MISSINSSTGLLAALGTRAANTAGSSPAPKEMRRLVEVHLHSAKRTPSK